MDSDAGSSTARRRRCFSSYSASSFPVFFFYANVLHGSLEVLGFVVLSAVDGLARRRCYHAKALCILVLTCNPLQLLPSTHVSDLCLTTCVCGSPYLSWWFELKHLLSGCMVGFKVLTSFLSSPCSIILISFVDLVTGVCGVPLLSWRPELESQNALSVSIPIPITTAFCLDSHSHPLCFNEDYGPSPTCLTSHLKPSCSPQASSASFDGWGFPPRTPPAAVHTDAFSFSLSLLVFIDLRLDSVLGKLSCFQHSNVVAESFCLCSVIVFMEAIVKFSPLSVWIKPQMVGSKGYTLLLGAIFGGFSNFSSIAHHQILTPTRANISQVLFLSWSLSKLEDCSPLAIFSIKASQTFSCRGHERPLSILLLFVGVTTSIKILLREKDSFLGYVANGLCRLPYRLMPYVMVRLGPEGTMILNPMRIEVMKRSTSQYTTTIPVEEFEGRCNLSSSLLVCGTFELSFDLLSSLPKLVSLSFFCLVLNVSIRIAHQLLDVAFIFVIG